jgi:hypothetical protein
MADPAVAAFISTSPLTPRFVHFGKLRISPPTGLEHICGVIDFTQTTIINEFLWYKKNAGPCSW